MRRELKVWLRLKHPTIVPLLGVAFLDPQAPLPALVSQWMPSGTLYIYMEKQATILTAPAKVALVSRTHSMSVHSHPTRLRALLMASAIVRQFLSRGYICS